MKNFWEKIKAFFSRIWNGLTFVGRIIVGIIILALIILIAFAVAKEAEKDSEETTPEIAQVYEPSIGTPLPPDVPGEASKTGEVGGASTNQSSNEQSQPTTNFVAPAAGIDNSKPIQYSNANLKFTATLPAYSNVIEDTEGVKFTAKNGLLHYIVSVNEASSENLETIEDQLRNSPIISNISPSITNNTKALKFIARGFGEGIVFISQGKIYYLLGESKYFADFKLL